MGIKCCQFCVPPKRHTACWDTCPEYIEEKAKDRAQKEAERKRRLINQGLYAQRSASVQKALSHRKLPPKK